MIKLKSASLKAFVLLGILATTGMAMAQTPLQPVVLNENPFNTGCQSIGPGGTTQPFSTLKPYYGFTTSIEYTCTYGIASRKLVSVKIVAACFTGFNNDGCNIASPAPCPTVSCQGSV